jgi:cell division protein ZipA
MEISVRDWMIIIGVLLIVAVLLDGYRRMRDPNRIRMSLTRVPDGPDDDVGMSRELPNGGARVKPRASNAGGADAADADADDAEHSQDFEPEAAPEPQGEPPLLTDTGERPDPLFDPQPAVSEAHAADADATPLSAGADRAAGENLDLLDGITADDERPASAAASATAGSPAADIPNEVLMLHVVSRDESGFSGEDILQVLLAYNLRFGDMDFFHRHEESAGRGAIQFSVANMLQPGVFDIDKMSDFSTTGLIFFLTLPGPRDMMGAFEQMLETARGVAENLGGDVLDESRSATTRQTLEHMRQRIRDLERKLLAQAGR